MKSILAKRLKKIEDGIVRTASFGVVALCDELRGFAGEFEKIGVSLSDAPISDGGWKHLVVRFEYVNPIETYDEGFDILKKLIDFLRKKDFSVDAELSDVKSGGLYVWFNGYSIG